MHLLKTCRKKTAGLCSLKIVYDNPTVSYSIDGELGQPIQAHSQLISLNPAGLVILASVRVRIASACWRIWRTLQQVVVVIISYVNKGAVCIFTNANTVAAPIITE